MGVSKTDLVNSGSYFFTDRVVVFGITTFRGFGGSFFNMGLIGGFIETSDFAVVSCLLTGACSFAGAFATLASCFFATTFGACFIGFLRAGLFAPAFLADDFPPAGRAGFAITFFTDAFLAGLALPATWADFLGADFPAFRGAGFLVGMLLPFF
jgi:hypothetical protein